MIVTVIAEIVTVIVTVEIVTAIAIVEIATVIVTKTAHATKWTVIAVTGGT